MLDAGFYNMDCMEGMSQFPDKFFDLAIVDPPYGDGGENIGGGVDSGPGSTDTKWNRFRGGTTFRKNMRGGAASRTGGTWAEKYGKKIIAWDVAPGDDYFKELFRVSRDQIIWGGNYFDLPPTRCFLIWRKLSISENFSMAMAEYAWTSLKGNAKVFECAPQGTANQERFHPTQKPVSLYTWILKRYEGTTG